MEPPLIAAEDTATAAVVSDARLTLQWSRRSSQRKTTLTAILPTKKDALLQWSRRSSQRKTVPYEAAVKLYKSLQWSRRSSQRKTTQLGNIERARELGFNGAAAHRSGRQKLLSSLASPVKAASMEPPLIAAEDDEYTRDERLHAVGFNGAAAHRSGRLAHW